MEIIFREEDITYNEITDPIIRKLEVATLISQKVIHFWYNDVFLWSKEGFIRFIGAYILHKVGYLILYFYIFTIFLDFTNANTFLN